MKRDGPKDLKLSEEGELSQVLERVGVLFLRSSRGVGWGTAYAKELQQAVVAVCVTR